MTVATRDVVNLIASLDDERFASVPVHHAIERWDRAGTRVERFSRAPDAALAWIDAEFGGSWSSEVAAGSVWLASDASGWTGFAAFDPRGLRFAWLDAWRQRPEVGVFGPFGVAPRARGTWLASLLLHAALFSLRERGYRDALIPAVGGDQLIAFYARHAGARVAERFDLAALAGHSRATVLASGDGSNFEAIVAASRAGLLPVEVTTLISNRRGAGALQRAERLGVDSRLVAWDRTAVARDAYDARVIDAVAESNPDLVLLLGWMHVLPARFVERFGEALNLHPSFLPLDASSDSVTMPDGTCVPALRGAHAVDDAFAAGVAWGGATMHRLALAVDRGAVLVRAPLRRDADEARDGYVERLHALERRVVCAAIWRWSYERPTGS